MKQVISSVGSHLILLSLCCRGVFASDSLEFSGSHIVPMLSEENRLTLEIDPSLCTKEVLMLFFPQPIVKAVLVQYGVNEVDAVKIAKELSQKDQEVVQIVEAKSAKLDPNPLNDLNRRDVAVKIFGETLYEVFAKSLKSNRVTADDDQIQIILDNMKEIKGKLFIECLKKEKMLIPERPDIGVHSFAPRKSE